MKKTQKYSEKRRFGNLGEDIACQFLQKHHFMILDRNVLRKWGEIDLVAVKNNKLHFIEVKTSRKNSPITPHQNLTIQKIEKCVRSAHLYMSERGCVGEYQLDAIFVILDDMDQCIDIEYFESFA